MLVCWCLDTEWHFLITSHLLILLKYPHQLFALTNGQCPHLLLIIFLHTLNSHLHPCLLFLVFIYHSDLCKAQPCLLRTSEHGINPLSDGMQVPCQQTRGSIALFLDHLMHIFDTSSGHLILHPKKNGPYDYSNLRHGIMPGFHRISV